MDETSQKHRTQGGQGSLEKRNDVHESIASRGAGVENTNGDNGEDSMREREETAQIRLPSVQSKGRERRQQMTQ